MNTIADIITALESAQELARTNARAAMGRAFKDFFDACPEIRAVTWTQYAPYFNDGDPCTFEVHEHYVVPFGDAVSADLLFDPCDELGLDDDDGPPVLVLQPPRNAARQLTEREAVLFAEWAKWRPAFDCEELMRAAFGDDCRVTATREGFKISGEDHD